jgi:hypothetical protein
MVFARERSAIRGSRSVVRDPTASPAARESEIGRYKAKVFRAIGSLWYLKVDQNQSVLGIGSVKIRFFIRANGVIEHVSTIDASGKHHELDAISKQSIIGSGPFDPFSDTMKLQLGEGYWEEVTFTIY